MSSRRALVYTMPPGLPAGSAFAFRAAAPFAAGFALAFGFTGRVVAFFFVAMPSSLRRAAPLRPEPARGVAS